MLNLFFYKIYFFYFLIFFIVFKEKNVFNKFNLCLLISKNFFDKYVSSNATNLGPIFFYNCHTFLTVKSVNLTINLFTINLIIFIIK